MCIKFNNKYLSQQEINEINNNGGYLVILNRKVIDISSIINNHPGGNKILLNKLGTDCSEDIKYHNKYVKKILKKLIIAKLK